MLSLSHFVSRGFTGQLNWTISNSSHIIFRCGLLMSNGAMFVRLVHHQPLSLKDRMEYQNVYGERYMGYHLSIPEKKVVEVSNQSRMSVHLMDCEQYHWNEVHCPQDCRKYLAKYHTWYYLNDGIINDIMYHVNVKRESTEKVYSSEFEEVDHSEPGSLSRRIFNQI